MTTRFTDDSPAVQRAFDTARLTVRLAVDTDAGAISDLVMSHSPIAPGEPGSEAFFASIGAQRIGDRLHLTNEVFLVAVDGNKLLGMIALQDNVRLSLFFVSKHALGQGIGRRLWAHLLSLAKERGNPGDFVVNSSLAAIEVYQTLGFVISGERVARSGWPEFIPMALTSA